MVQFFLRPITSVMVGNYGFFSFFLPNFCYLIENSLQEVLFHNMAYLGVILKF